jgi:hypothetical protein
MNQELEKAKAAGGIRQSSNRSFGIVMAVFFFLISAISAWKHQWTPLWYWPALSALFGFFALALPAALSPLNRAWTILGLVLHRVMNPLVMGLLFFGFVTPLGWVFRFMKGDTLRLKINKTASTYWITREDKDQPGKGMANQF